MLNAIDRSSRSHAAFVGRSMPPAAKYARAHTLANRAPRCPLDALFYARRRAPTGRSLVSTCIEQAELTALFYVLYHGDNNSKRKKESRDNNQPQTSTTHHHLQHDGRTAPKRLKVSKCRVSEFLGETQSQLDSDPCPSGCFSSSLYHTAAATTGGHGCPSCLKNRLGFNSRHTLKPNNRQG